MNLTNVIKLSFTSTVTETRKLLKKYVKGDYTF